jgi:hypothetical protein
MTAGSIVRVVIAVAVMFGVALALSALGVRTRLVDVIAITTGVACVAVANAVRR